MMYVLLIFIGYNTGFSSTGNSNAITSQEFSSKEKCEKALTELPMLVKDTNQTIKGICIEK